MKITSNNLAFLPRAYAHCDVPCGVYEPDSMKWAALTCARLVEKLLALTAPNTDDKEAVLEYQNTVTRTIMVKEEYAEICKKQILILWTDYFKPEHLEKFPDLHTRIWMATKQCSIVKRTVNTEETAKLKKLVEEIASIFAESKK